MTFNTPLAIDALAHIQWSVDNPDSDLRWEQDSWGTAVRVGTIDALNWDLHPPSSAVASFYTEEGMPACGTGMCMGGWALSLAGIKMAFGPSHLGIEGVVYRAYYTQTSTPIADAAADVLGLDYSTLEEQGMWLEDDAMPTLFAYDNTLDNLYTLTAVHAEMDEGELRVAVKDRMDSF